MSAHRILDIYVAPGCFGCQTALQLAAMVRDLALPGVEVRLIDLTEPDAVRPEAVFAVPTYVLNGSVLSLGNPEQTWLIDRLRAAPGEGAESTSEGGA